MIGFGIWLKKRAFPGNYRVDKTIAEA